MPSLWPTSYSVQMWGWDRFGLPLQALLQRRIGGKAGKQNLDGNRAVEPRVVGAIDFAHAAGAERSSDLVRAEFVARREWHTSQSTSGGEARPLSGTEAGTYPFWSPDSKWLGFFSSGKLKKAPIETGPVLELADAPRARGGSWGTNNMILFAPTPTGNILVVSATGGAAKAVTTLNSEMHTTHRWPVWLADGNRFLYLASSHGIPAANEHNGIYIASLDGAKDRMLMPADSNAVLAPGYLLFVQSDILMAVPFNERSGELSGDPAPVAQDVSYNPGTVFYQRPDRGRPLFRGLRT